MTGYDFATYNNHCILCSLHIDDFLICLHKKKNKNDQSKVILKKEPND